MFAVRGDGLLPCCVRVVGQLPCHAAVVPAIPWFAALLCARRWPIALSRCCGARHSVPGNPKMRDRAGKRMMVVVSYQGTPHLQVLNMRGHRMSPRTVKQLTDACDGYFDLIL